MKKFCEILCCKIMVNSKIFCLFCQNQFNSYERKGMSSFEDLSTNLMKYQKRFWTLLTLYNFWTSWQLHWNGIIDNIFRMVIPHVLNWTNILWSTSFLLPVLFISQMSDKFFPGLIRDIKSSSLSLLAASFHFLLCWHFRSLASKG